MNADIMNQLPAFLECIMLNEEPMGVHYTDTAPENCVSPKSQRPLSREAEEKGEIDWISVQKKINNSKKRWGD
jgi:hypothetical protein